MKDASLITIVGGGVSGLSTGILLAQRGCKTRIVSPLPPLQTTSSVAAAFWYPLHVEGYQPRWAQESLQHFLALEDNSAAELHRVGGREFFHRPEHLKEWLARCEWRDIPALEFRILRQHELVGRYTCGIGYRLPVIFMQAYLPFLEKWYQSLGGSFERRSISSFEEVLQESRAIINCTGLGAGALAGDKNVFPCQGQLVSVAPLNFDELIMVDCASDTAEVSGAANETLYIVPRHGHDIVLGGTRVDGATDLTPDPQVTRQIIDRCAALFPIFNDAKIIESRVGLRPARHGGVRTELDAEFTRRHGKPLVHNYGHGGAGVSLSWGCAQEVVRILQSLE